MIRGRTSACGILTLLFLGLSAGFEFGTIDNVRRFEHLLYDKSNATIFLKDDMVIDFFWKLDFQTPPSYNFSMLWDATDVKIDSSLPPSGKLPRQGEFSLHFQSQISRTFTLLLSFNLTNYHPIYKIMINTPAAPQILYSRDNICNTTGTGQCNNRGKCVDGLCVCYNNSGWSGPLCENGCVSDEGCIHGKCNQTTGICKCDDDWGTRYGAKCDWGLHFEKTEVCPLELIKFNWTLPDYEFADISDGMFIYYSKTKNFTVLNTVPVEFNDACYNTFLAYVWPWSSHWDHTSQTAAPSIDMKQSSFNWTYHEEGFLSFYLFPDFICQNLVGKGVTVLKKTDPRCSDQTTEPTNCTNLSVPYLDVSNERWGCNCSDYTFGNYCEYGCLKQKYITDNGGTVTDGSGPIYRPLLNAQCSWIIAPSIPVTSMRIEFSELWTNPGTLTFDFLQTNDSTQLSIPWVGRPFADFFRTITIFTKGPLTVNFLTTSSNPPFGWSFSYIPTGCPPGSYINIDTYTCDPCPVGNYSTEADKYFCYACPPGTFQDVINQTSCKPCELNLYQNLSGQAKCQSCPKRTHTISKSTTDIDQCICDDGYYAVNETTGVECIDCPEGASCPGGSYSFFADNNQTYVNVAPHANPRYWASSSDPYKFLKCSSVNACPGGPPDTCGEGFTQNMCSRCEKGYYNRLGKCNKCSGTSNAWLPIIVIVLLPLCAILYRMVNRKDFVRFATLLSISTAFGLLISFLQIIVVYQNFRIQWPKFITNIYAVISILNFNIDLSAPECSVQNISDYQKYILKLFLPLVFPACFVVLHGLCYLQVLFVKYFGDRFKAAYPNFCRQLTQEESERKRWTLAKGRRWFSELFTVPQPMNVNFSINTLIMIFDLAYIYLCQSTFNIFNCYKNTDGSYSLYNDPETRCYESQWFRYLPFTILSILFYVLSFPCLLVYVIYIAPMKQENKEFMQRYNQLFFRFQPSKYWWEAVIVARKFCITFVILIVSSDAVIQTTLSIAFIVASLLLHLYNWPYWVNDCNYLEAGLLVVNLGILAIALLFIGDDPLQNFGNDKGVYNFYSGLVVFFIVIGFVGAVGVSIWSLFRFFKPVPKRLVSSEQEAVVGMWTSLTSKNSQADFDAVWRQLPREEQQMAIHSAEAFTYEALGRRGTKIRRVSPSRLRYAEELKKRQEARAMRVEEIGDSEYNEEDLIQLPSMDGGSSSSGPPTQSSITSGVAESETSTGSPKSVTAFPSVVAESSRDGLIPKDRSSQKSTRKKNSIRSRSTKETRETERSSRRSHRSRRKERRGSSRGKDRMDDGVSSVQDEKKPEVVSPHIESTKQETSNSNFEETPTNTAKINVQINSHESEKPIPIAKRPEKKKLGVSSSDSDSSSSSSESDSD